MAELKWSVLDHRNFVATIWQGEIVQMNTLERAEMHNSLAYSDLWMSFSTGPSLGTKLKLSWKAPYPPTIEGIQVISDERSLLFHICLFLVFTFKRFFLKGKRGCLLSDIENMHKLDNRMGMGWGFKTDPTGCSCFERFLPRHCSFPVIWFCKLSFSEMKSRDEASSYPSPSETPQGCFGILIS